MAKIIEKGDNFEIIIDLESVDVVREAFLRAGERAAILAEAEIKRAMSNSPRGGRTYRSRGGARDHIASAPDEAPAPDIGELMQNVNFFVDKDKKNPSVGVGVTGGEKLGIRANALEYGTRDGRIAKRPAFVPAWKDQLKQFPGYIRQAIRRLVD